MTGAAGYRPDIDGLRAIAVLAVILFHFADENLPGGYLGVDIFFVLSGYLITQIIHGEILAGRFTVRGFYERRVRRIVPALLVLLAFSSVFAVLLLLPTDLVRFGKYLLATLGFVANLFAWRDTNYFSPLADQKPLLHTWSLGVEEQFYILFPLLLWLLARRWPRLVLPAVIATTVVSFVLNYLAIEVRVEPAAFYLLPMRAWELGVGASIALAARAGMSRSQHPMRTIAALAGLALIAAGLLMHDALASKLLAASFAVAGTALLLGIGSTPVARLLGFAPLVWTGLISYSLYLWHWPVIVFTKYYLVRELQPLEVAGLWLFMFAAAALSWRFVERPFRRREYPVRRLYLGSAAGTLVLAVVALVLLQTRGLPGRLSADAAAINESVGTHFYCPIADRLEFRARDGCALNMPSRNPADAQLVLLGNSHAQMYAPVWRTILEQRNETGLLVTMSGCLPTVSANINPGCVQSALKNLEMVNALPKVRTVVLAMTWWHGPDAIVDPAGRPLDNRDKAALIAALDDLIARLRVGGRHVVLIGPIAVPGWNVSSVVSRQIAFGHPVVRPLTASREKFEKDYAGVFRHFSGRSDVSFARPDLVQCDAESCRYIIDGQALFSDENHFAAAAVERFRGVFMEALGQ